MNVRGIFRTARIVMIGSPGARVLLYLKLTRFLRPQSKIRRFLHKMMQRYGVYVSPNAVIGVGLKMPHPVGVVVGSGVVIGQNVTIFQNVTIGGARTGDNKDNNYPTINDNVVIFAGAVIAGKIVIGNGAVIGANAVVLTDVPAGATCVGVPGRIIHSKIKTGAGP